MYNDIQIIIMDGGVDSRAIPCRWQLLLECRNLRMEHRYHQQGNPNFLPNFACIMDVMSPSFYTA